jgi:hypothetical protein
MLSRFRSSVLAIHLWIAHDCCPAAYPLGEAPRRRECAPLTDSDLTRADVALVSGMLVQKDNLLVILARCRASGIRAQAQD